MANFLTPPTTTVSTNSGGTFTDTVMFTQLANSLTPALRATISPEIQQLSLAINAMSTRMNLPGSTFLQGINTSSQLGIGGDQGLGMVARMQQAINGLGIEAQSQRRTLRDYGITTTDANAALRQFVTTLSRVQPGIARNLAASQFGIDPALLSPSNAARLNPIAGGEADFQQKQADQVARVQAMTAQMMEQNRADALTMKTMFFGLLPSMNAIRTSASYSFGSPLQQANQPRARR